MYVLLMKLKTKNINKVNPKQFNTDLNDLDLSIYFKLTKIFSFIYHQMDG